MSASIFFAFLFRFLRSDCLRLSCSCAQDSRACSLNVFNSVLLSPCTRCRPDLQTYHFGPPMRTEIRVPEKAQPEPSGGCVTAVRTSRASGQCSMREREGVGKKLVGTPPQRV